ncbi:pirin family protein [Yinghuangia seranimata]|uniref:pirin family protein n=1 Tax=Yinghuangia seranimata TaxID=408067 RepID=UPI00248AA001|nr:pirin family protein [Yinghuangia seranimata]MDI2126480.1 pirin family protein [Yinghuangia seranimata]
MTVRNPTARGVAAVLDRRMLGADAQVDDKALVLEPGKWGRHDPFLLLAEDWFSAVGFDWHPHRGQETVTLVLEGHAEHRDNRGGHGVLGPGDVQWMTAGRGLFHAEKAYRGEPVHLLQLWVNLPAAHKMDEPRYQDLRADAMPVHREDGVEVRVFSGRSGDAVGPAFNVVPVTMLDGTLAAGATYDQDVPADQNGFVYVLSGAGRFGPDATPAKAGQVVHLEPAPTRGVDEDAAPGTLRIAADDPDGLRFVLWTGRPVREPVAAYGPFVMNTRREIEQAVADVQSGVFGEIPEG